MAVFAYRALDTARSVVRGTVTADTPRQARDGLRSQGLTIEVINEITSARAPRETAAAASRRRTVRLALPFTTRTSTRGFRGEVFYSDLATLIGVGIPILESLDTLIAQGGYGKQGQVVLMKLRDALASGASLTTAMADQPAVFDGFSQKIVSVGEQTGGLDRSLERLAHFRYRSAQFKGKLLNALAYPCFVLIVAIAVGLFLMTAVVPQLLEGLLQADRPIPVTTQIVKTTSDLLVQQWALLLGALVGVVVLAASVLRTSKGRRGWHKLLLRAPLVGPIASKQAVAELATVVSTLMRSGISFVEAVSVASSTSRNVIVSDALRNSEQQISTGSGIAEALRQTQVFPPMVVQVFAVGQQAGRLEDMLDRLATDYNRQVELATQRLTSVLEPAMILAMVVLVGFIAFAVILPMMEAGNVL